MDCKDFPSEMTELFEIANLEKETYLFILV